MRAVHPAVSMTTVTMELASQSLTLSLKEREGTSEVKILLCDQSARKGTGEGREGQ